MDSGLWGGLPQDLLQRVLMRVPWWSAMKFRSVSKTWHSLLSDPSSLARSVAGDKPCPIVSNHRFYYAILDPDAQTCPVIPCANIFPMDHPEANRFQLEDTAGGLFLMRVSFQCRDRYLFNPLNATRKLLPPVPEPEIEDPLSPWAKLHQPKTWLVTDNTGNLRVVCFQVRETLDGMAETVLWNAHVYDLEADAWREYCVDVPAKRLEFCLSATLVDDELYLMAKSQYGGSGRKLHRLFRVSSGRMTEVPISFTDGILAVQVFQCRGALMVMTGTEEPRKEGPYHVKLWRYEPESEAWRHVGSMPGSFIDTFYRTMSNEGGFYFDVEGDVCCFANRLDSDFIALYDIGMDRWWHVSCSEEVQQDLRDLHVQCRVTFLWQPRLDSSSLDS